MNLDTLVWPASRLGEGLEILARRSGFLLRPVDAPSTSEHLMQADDALIYRWMQAAVSRFDLEVEPVFSTYADLTLFLRGAGPAIIPLPATVPDGERQFLLLVHAGTYIATVIAPNSKLRRVRVSRLHKILSTDLEAPYEERIQQILARAHIPRQRHEKVRQALLSRILASQHINGGWMLRLSPGSPLGLHIRHLRLPAYVLALLATLATRHLLEIMSWWMIGQTVFQGLTDSVWLSAWSLLMFSTIPFLLIEYWIYFQVTIIASALAKQRLLYGTFQLDPEEIRHQGTGQFMGLVMDTETIEQLALSGGFQLIAAPVKLIAAAAILALGAAGTTHALLLLAWIGVELLLLWRYYRASEDWMHSHRRMANELVERMVGHRTRLAQEDRTRWHQAEDRSVAQYITLSHHLDRIANHIYATVPSGWLLIGLGALVPTFLNQTGTSATIAVSLGGVLLAFEGLTLLVTGVQSGTTMLVSCKHIAPFWQAAGRRRDQPLDASLLTRFSQPSSTRTGKVLVADELTFRYPDRLHPVVQECNLEIHQAERLLLEGPSGGGKSTLSALLTGLRTPQSGLLLLWGYDYKTVGSREWRRRVVSAPQFHENHVLTESFAFNLLMGRHWPATAEDLAEAETICQELGLGELLERMPSGILQMVGEGGWQLSHGERSRLYIARALLQNADLIILDESFAALDPENLQRALECVFKRAPTLLVIAHP